MIVIDSIVLPKFQLPDVAQRSAHTQNIPFDITFHLSTTSLLGNIMEPRYRKNNTGYHILRIGNKYIFDYLDYMIPYIDLPISWLPEVTQKTTYTENVATDFTFH